MVLPVRKPASTLFAPGLEPLLRPVAELREDPNNARAHDERNIEAIKTSLGAFGQRKPIVVRDGVVVAGNGTLRAAVALGWDRIAVVDADDLSPAEAAAYALADNRTAELATWDTEALRRTVEPRSRSTGGSSTTWRSRKRTSRRSCATRTVACGRASAATSRSPSPTRPENVDSEPGASLRTRSAPPALRRQHGPRAGRAPVRGRRQGRALRD